MGRNDVVDLLLHLGAKLESLGRNAGSNIGPLELAIKGGHLSTAQEMMQIIEVTTQNERHHFVGALLATIEKGYEAIVKSL